MIWFSFLYEDAEDWFAEPAASPAQLQPVVESRRDADSGLILAVSMFCKGQTMELIRGAPQSRGFEAWRRLVQEFGVSQTAALTQHGALLKLDQVDVQGEVFQVARPPAGTRPPWDRGRHRSGGAATRRGPGDRNAARQRAALWGRPEGGAMGREPPHPVPRVPVWSPGRLPADERPLSERDRAAGRMGGNRPGTLGREPPRTVPRPHTHTHTRRPPSLSHVEPMVLPGRPSDQ